MNKVNWHKCKYVYERHDSAEMQWLSKYVPAFITTLPNANMRFHSCYSLATRTELTPPSTSKDQQTHFNVHLLQV